MKTYIESPSVLITHHVKPLDVSKKHKDGDVILHRKTVQYIELIRKEYDSCGQETGIAKITMISINDLKKIMTAINEIESPTFEQIYQDDSLPF